MHVRVVTNEKSTTFNVSLSESRGEGFYTVGNTVFNPIVVGHPHLSYSDNA
jgi:hypothetical protein